MTKKLFDVVILTDDRYVAPKKINWYIENILEEDRLLQSALENHGLKVGRKSWSDPKFDWSKTKQVIFRSTWDYFDRIEDWQDWLKRTNEVTHMINPFPLIEWNMDKHYLADLRQKGINIPDTAYLEKGSKRTLTEIFDQKGWHTCMLKPCISAAARLTFKIDRENLLEHEEIFQRHIRHEAFMLQPFQTNITKLGEVSFMVMGGQFTHAVLKRAKAGDFRVQDDFGGTVHPYHASEEEIAFAEKAIAACEPKPLYARVDVFRDNNGELAVIELEMIEPELWFRMKPEAAEVLAKAIVDYS